MRDESFSCHLAYNDIIILINTNNGRREYRSQRIPDYHRTAVFPHTCKTVRRAKIYSYYCHLCLLLKICYCLLNMTIVYTVIARNPTTINAPKIVPTRGTSIRSTARNIENISCASHARIMMINPFFLFSRL